MLDYSRLRPTCRKELERIDAADAAGHPEWADLPRTRAEAVALGTRRMFTGIACVNGHTEIRSLTDGCLGCRRGPVRRAWENDRDRTKKRDYMLAFFAARRASKLEATPSWLTKAQLKVIRKIYTKATTLGWHVDHIIPLKGRKACGLHVPWNLRPLPGAENASKGNRINLAEEEASHWEWLVDTGQAIGKRKGIFSS